MYWESKSLALHQMKYVTNLSSESQGTKLVGYSWFHKIHHDSRCPNDQTSRQLCCTRNGWTTTTPSLPKSRRTCCATSGSVLCRSLTELFVSWQRYDVMNIVSRDEFISDASEHFRPTRLAASLRRNIVDPGFLLDFFSYSTQRSNNVDPKKIWKKSFFFKQKNLRHVPSLKSSNLQSYQNRTSNKKVRVVES